MENIKIEAAKIRMLREVKGLSVRELAILTNMTPSQISDLENEQLKNTTVDTICKLAIALEVKAADLFTC